MATGFVRSAEAILFASGMVSFPLTVKHYFLTSCSFLRGSDVRILVLDVGEDGERGLATEVKLDPGVNDCKANLTSLVSIYFAVLSQKVESAFLGTGSRACSPRPGNDVG